MTGVIRQVFDDHLPDILAQRDLSEREWRGAWCIATCRTIAQGTHISECPAGHVRTEEYNSCRHRSCPACGWLATQRWIEAREAQVLACPHVHTIFTLPEVFNRLWAYNRSTFTDLLFHAAWDTVRKLMADPRWCGARPGMFAVFQSWGDTLPMHPHLHALVTAGGIAPDGSWHEPVHSFVLCARVAMALFRGRMRAFILDAIEEGTMVCPPGTDLAYWVHSANRQGLRKWNVRVQPPYAEPGRVIRYAAAYLKRGPLSERRVLAYDGHVARILLRHRLPHAAPTFDLTGEELVHRLLDHMPEPGLHTSRFYGLYQGACRSLYEAARAHWAQAPAPAPPSETAAATCVRLFAHATSSRCPVCSRPLLVREGIRGGQSPPWSYREQQRERAA